MQIPGGVQLHNYWGRVLVQICGEVSEGSGACARVSQRCSFIQVFERFDSYGFLAVNGGGLFILGFFLLVVTFLFVLLFLLFPAFVDSWSAFQCLFPFAVFSAAESEAGL